MNPNFKSPDEPRRIDTQILREDVPTEQEIRQHGGAFADTRRDKVREAMGLNGTEDAERKKQMENVLHNKDLNVNDQYREGKPKDRREKKRSKDKVAPLDLEAAGATEDGAGKRGADVKPLDPETPMHDRINAHKSVSRATTPRGEQGGLSRAQSGVLEPSGGKEGPPPPPNLALPDPSSGGNKTKGVLKKTDIEPGGNKATVSESHGTSGGEKTGTGGSSSFRAIRERTAKLKEARRQARLNTGITEKGRNDRVMHQRNEGRSFRKGMPLLSETIEFTLDRVKTAYKEAEDEKMLTKKALRMRQKGQKVQKDDKNSLSAMVVTFLTVAKAIIFHHVFPNINNNSVCVMMFNRILPCLEFPIQYLAVFCEPQLGYSMGQMCPYDPGYDPSADAIDPIEGVPKGEPLVQSFPFSAPFFGVLLPYLCIFTVWYRSIPYVRLRILSNRSLVIGMLLCRSILTVKRNPASVQTGMGIDAEDAMLTVFSLSSWFLLGAPLIYFIDLVIFLGFFPLREPPNFLAAAKFFKGQLMMICGSPSFILFDVILMTSEGPGGPRQTTFAMIGMLISMFSLWFQVLRVTQVAYRNLLTSMQVLQLTSRMGKGTGGDSISQVQKAKLKDIKAAEARLFPPFFIVLAQMKICSLEQEKYVINEKELAQFGHCLFNNIYIRHLVIPASCCKNLVKAGYTLFDAIEHCVIKLDNCVLETFNWFAIKDILYKPKLVYTMDRYRYGHEKLNLPYEMSFSDSAYYLVAGERIQQPWSDLEAIVFCRMLPYNGNLVHLDLSSNLIKDYGFIALAEFLFCNSQLKYLNVSNNDLDALQDRTLDTLLDSIVSHPRLEAVQFTASTIQLPLRDFEDAEVLKWDAYNVYTINVNQIVSRVIDLVMENQLSFDNFPAHCRFDHYVNIIENIISNDMSLSRQVAQSLHPKLKRFVAERCAKKLGHPLGFDPEDLLDLYVKDSRKVKTLTKLERATKNDLYVNPKERIGISCLTPLEGMCMAMTLRFSRFLREIFLEGNKIRDRGAEMFFRLLCEPGNVVEMLSLANNDIGYARNNYVKGRAVKWLQRALQLHDLNPRLQQVDLYQNSAFVAFEREIRVWVMGRPQSDDIMPLTVNVKRR